MKPLKSTGLLSEQLRPRSIADCALPRRLKVPFTKMQRNAQVMNMLFYGSAGTGKTTVARILAGQHDESWNSLILNGSVDNDVRTMERTVQHFATSISFEGGMKVCLIDEADYLTASAQAGLRGIVEATSSNCRFLFTANYLNKISAPLQSRLKPLCFDLQADEEDEVIGEYLEWISLKLKRGRIAVDQFELSRIVHLYFPDYRAIANEIEFIYC